MRSDNNKSSNDKLNVSDYFEGMTGVTDRSTETIDSQIVFEEAPENFVPRSAKGSKRTKKEKKGKKDKGGTKGGKTLRIALIVVSTLVIVFGAVIGAGITVVNNKVDLITKVQVDREALGIDPRVAEELKNYRNIALLGIDSRSVSDDSNSRSDAMIIASIDKTTSDVRLLSIFRDTYVSLGDNYGLDKLTHAYFYGGPTQTLQSINRNLDLNCEEVIVVNWKSVADAVDALGGLDIKIQESEIKEMNKYIRDTQKNIGGSKAKIKKAGMQTLNGNQAVTYARIRKDSAKGDYRRNERMEIVVEAAFAKAKTLSLTQLNKIADEILPQVKTNMTSNQLMEIILNLNGYKMGKSESWPYHVASWTHNGVWYGPPVTLQRNVVELHAKYFKQKEYDPTDTVKKISNSISSITNMW